jgi:hypothetical protein
MITTAVRKLIILPALIISAMVFVSQANASGSFSSTPSAPKVDSPYDKGKRAFNRKVACKKCPLPGKKIDAEKARSVIEAIYTDEQFSKLSDKQRENITVYLAKRYKLK